MGADGLAPATRVLYDKLRAIVPPVVEDRSMSHDIEKVAAALLEGSWLQAVEEVTGALF
ncbi:MIO-dependent tyrosine 2,3-aminomutase [compost metagenome]